jgi:CheY-like chemotaxis protein
VTDTGIGIPEDKQKLVFEAFKQVDGSNSRKYGGTGLGLTISRELCLLLGGDLTLHSIEGAGSTFSVYLPCGATPETLAASAGEADYSRYKDYEIEDDRNAIAPGEPVVLIVEDDPVFAQSLAESAREHHCKAVVALRGEDGLQYARHYNPEKIILDVQLPGIDGWSVLQTLKSDDSLNHIPVYIVSASDQWTRGLTLGAADYITKPCTPEGLARLFAGLDEAAGAETPASWQPDEPPAGETNGRDLRGLTVLMADDDMRNIYSLSVILESEGMNVVIAHDGQEALDKLGEGKNVDIVLMDIMMPGMDGYAAMRAIRKIEKFRRLPILAITAKAMKNDRRKCLDAGASDYLSKPVKAEVLLAALRKWAPAPAPSGQRPDA